MKSTTEYSDLHLFKNVTAPQIRDLTKFHLRFSRGKDARTATPYDLFYSFSYAIRDLIVERFITTQAAYVDQDVKRIYYLSMEFLIGKFLKNNLLALGCWQPAMEALQELGLSLDSLTDMDVEPGLGNGGLGRLAACYLDSLAAQEMPAYGYGLRYEFGIFRQDILEGWQNESPDDWLTLPFPWEMVRPEYTLPVLIYGRIEKQRTSSRKGEEQVWLDWQMFEGIPYDMPIVGYGTNSVNILRLWKAQAARGFHLDAFNRGDYAQAVAEKNWAENVTKVLYPADSTFAGRELRLIQEYFLVTCAVRDIIRRFKKKHNDLRMLAEKNAIQLNDTHPAMTVAELMRCLIDEEKLPWNDAWDVTVKTCSFTNHTLMAEALEKWPVETFEKVLPRHLQIIYEINARFLQQVELRYPGNTDMMRDLSLIEEDPVKQVRMANLAVVGSHAVNGVSALHSELLKTQVMKKFSDFFPDRFLNITNGITPRRWLAICNPDLAALITAHIGPDWARDLEQLRQLEPLAVDPGFQDQFLQIKAQNKKHLAEYIHHELGQEVLLDSLFDVQIKRLHMYKRQLLNVMHIITLYHRLKKDPHQEMTPRTFIFAAKSAPSYAIAKRVIKLINNLSLIINHDAAVAGRLKVLFLPNYNVTLAERIIPAADLSEQISTAGLEASGTGNMKLSLNGALTIGTWDGANIEIAQHVGEDNIFIFGHRVEEIEALRSRGYNPWDYYNNDSELRETLDTLRNGDFAPEQRDLFQDLFNELTQNGDGFFYLADYRAYCQCQDRVAAAYRDKRAWARMAILNVARMGWFSSDRSIREYNDKVWHAQPLHIDVGGK